MNAFATDGRAVEVQRRDLRAEPLALRVGLEHQLGVAAPEGDRAAADALHELEQVGPGLLRDHLAEERAEQPDLAGQLVAGARRSPGPGGSAATAGKRAARVDFGARRDRAGGWATA